MALKKYIKSFRLRTLPLSMSGIILGCGWAAGDCNQMLRSVKFWVVFALAILTTLSLQILSNLCNELGDSERGTDQEQQTRAAYGLQAGEITIEQMKKVICVFVGLCVVFGTALVWVAFGSLLKWQSIVFLLLGAFAIWGAMSYTLGKHNYGYLGLGDLGVFVFFGLLSTMGSYYLQAHTMSVSVVLAAVAIAMPIVGVLNLNNVRDMPNDLKHGKRTFASLLGPIGGRIYHTALLMVCMLIFTLLQRYFVLIVLPVLIWHCIYIFKNEGAKLDLQMPVLMFTTIFISLLALIP